MNFRYKCEKQNKKFLTNNKIGELYDFGAKSRHEVIKSTKNTDHKK